MDIKTVSEFRKIQQQKNTQQMEENPQNIRIKEQKKEKLYRPESTHTENTLKNQCEIGPKTCCGK
jgi:hypothetical protein